MFLTGEIVGKLVMKDNGSPNWTGIIIFTLMLIITFIWRCCEFIPENKVATRRRFNRIVRDKDGEPVEYDPLRKRELSERRRKWRRRRESVTSYRLLCRLKPRKQGVKERCLRIRIYLLHSLVVTDCGDNETDLEIDTISLCKSDFVTSISAAWRVSRDLGCPTKSFLKPADGRRWGWRQDKSMLEQLVRKFVANAVLVAYESLEAELTEFPTRMPSLDFEENEHIQSVRRFLYQEYGVEVFGLLYGRRFVSPARRQLEGMTLLADAISGTQPEPTEHTAKAMPNKSAIAAGGVVVSLQQPHS